MRDERTRDQRLTRFIAQWREWSHRPTALDAAAAGREATRRAAAREAAPRAADPSRRSPGGVRLLPLAALLILALALAWRQRPPTAPRPAPVAKGTGAPLFVFPLSSGTTLYANLPKENRS